MGSSSVIIEYLPVDIHAVHAEKLTMKMSKSLDLSRLFVWISVFFFGAGGGGRTRTVSLPLDFELFKPFGT